MSGANYSSNHSFDSWKQTAPTPILATTLLLITTRPPLIERLAVPPLRLLCSTLPCPALPFSALVVSDGAALRNPPDDAQPDLHKPHIAHTHWLLTLRRPLLRSARQRLPL
jgi:hypothetical protein